MERWRRMKIAKIGHKRIPGREGGVEVVNSHHEVDKKHVEYWQECIDKDYKPVHMTHQLSMIPNRVLAAF